MKVVTFAMVLSGAFIGWLNGCGASAIFHAQCFTPAGAICGALVCLVVRGITVTGYEGSIP